MRVPGSMYGQWKHRTRMCSSQGKMSLDLGCDELWRLKAPKGSRPLSGSSAGWQGSLEAITAPKRSHAAMPQTVTSLALSQMSSNMSCPSGGLIHPRILHRTSCKFGEIRPSSRLPTAQWQSLSHTFKDALGSADCWVLLFSTCCFCSLKSI